MTRPDPERIARWTLDLCAEDSTTGQEDRVLPRLAGLFRELGAAVRLQPVAGARSNLLATWGRPRFLFSTHMDTVPPYLPPRRDGDRLYGRGTCDAKGILATMAEAARLLLERGHRDFGFLVLVAEETDSLGAQAALELKPDLPGLAAVVNGEPTGNRLATGQKGTLHLRLRCRGRAAHSATPEAGVNAIFPLLDWINGLRALPLAEDARLGRDTWNLGLLSGGRAFNIVPDAAQADLLARTVPGSTFLQDVQRLRPGAGEAEVVFRREPIVFPVLEGFPTVAVPFGSDAHALRHLAQDDCVVLAGPGSILVAHTEDEHLDLAEAVAGAELYVALGETLLARPAGR